MIYDPDHFAALVERGEVSEADAQAAATFAKFLDECARYRGPFDAMVDPAFRDRWLGWVTGETPGPVDRSDD